MGISRVLLVPQNAKHRVRQRDLSIWISDTNDGDYTQVTGYSFVQKADGSLLLKFGSLVQGRYLKAKTIWDDRDWMQDGVVNDYASFENGIDKLIQVTVLKTTRTEAYSYDSNHNRITTNLDGSSSSSNYYPNANGGDLSLLQFDGTWHYQYDANGNLTGKAKALVGQAPDTTQEYWSYQWDLFNRLTSVRHDGAPSTTYIYNAAGMRVQRTGSKGTTLFMYSSGGSLIYSRNTTSGLVRTIVSMGSTIIGWTDTQAGTVKKYFASTDQIGSVTQVTDASGTVVWASEYSAFGTVDGVQGTYNFTGFFTGKDVDFDTGLYYFNARWYDASTGRFLSEDPAGQGTNWYSYCGNGPENRVDSTGYSWDWGTFWSGVGVGTAAVAAGSVYSWSRAVHQCGHRRRVRRWRRCQWRKLQYRRMEQ